MKRHAGFTLIELLVVIAIIALLVSILIPSLQSAKEQAEGVSCMATMKSLKDGFDFYVSDWSVIPAYNVSAVGPAKAAGIGTISWYRRLEGSVGGFPLGAKYLKSVTGANSAYKCVAAKRIHGEDLTQSYAPNMLNFAHHTPGWPEYFAKPDNMKYAGETWLLFEQWSPSSPQHHRKARNILMVNGGIKGYSALCTPNPIISTADTNAVWTDQKRHGCTAQGSSGHEHKLVYKP